LASAANLEALIDIADGLDAARSISNDLAALESGAIDSYNTGELADVVSEMCPDHEVIAQVVSR
jgi:hypothetical protein